MSDCSVAHQDDLAVSAPGYSSIRPNTAAPLAEILRLNGYATAQFGKCHEVPTWESDPLGRFDHWPTGSGFEHFYGFVAGETTYGPNGPTGTRRRYHDRDARQARENATSACR
jgi:arylsulfatase A-like enzyme